MTTRIVPNKKASPVSGETGRGRVEGPKKNTRQSKDTPNSFAKSRRVATRANPGRKAIVHRERRTSRAGSADVRYEYSYSADELLQIKFPKRSTVLSRLDKPVLRAGDIVEVFAPRGIGKTWFLLTLAMVAASGTEALGFRTPRPCRVLIIDGEMAKEDLQERLRHLYRLLGVTHGSNLRLIAADWQDDVMPRLDTDAGAVQVSSEIENADLVIVDNRSCLFDPESEMDPAKWTKAQAWLLLLRRRGKAVVLAHHANRQGGARGHSKPEDLMDGIIKLSRPDDYSQEQGARFRVEWEKSRRGFGIEFAPFVARLGDDGWINEGVQRKDASSVDQKVIEYLRKAEGLGQSPKSGSSVAKAAHLQKQPCLAAVKRLLSQGIICHRDQLLVVA